MRSRLIYHKRNVCMCCKLSAGDFGVLRMSFQTLKTDNFRKLDKFMYLEYDFV